MTPSDIKSGMKFGHWEVIKFDHTNEHRVKYFLCKCDVCGTVRPVRATALINGTSTACSKACSSDIVGQKFGRWTVLRRDANRPRYYICKCDCGTERSVFNSSLKTGKTLSCGCLGKEHQHQIHEKNQREFIGQKFGKLTVLDLEYKNQSCYFICKCDCGNTITAKASNVKNGNTYSCGCLNSWANTEMEKILLKYNIPYKREYRFVDCRDKQPLPFDFCLFNNVGEVIGLIENNGSQHYQQNSHFKNNLEYVQKHDYIKYNYAYENNIPLLIIPYQYFNNLEDFLISSNFWKIITKNFND